MKRKSICCTSYLRKHISYDCYIWYTCVKWWYLQVFFSLFQILILWFVGRGGGKKGKKWSKMRINSVCRDQYLRNHNHVIFIYGTSFVVLMYKMTISLGFFSYFQNFDFLGYQGGGGGQMAKNSPKFMISICSTQV